MNNLNTHTKFSSYNLSEELLDTLSMLGYNEPTMIQQLAIPAVMDGKDVVGKSQTGSGKTAAFAIPICENIVWQENLPQALVLEPTRELAVQVQEAIFQIGRKKRIKVPVVFGGMPIDKQKLSLKQKAHIVVGTPGRVLDHIRRDTLVLDNVRYLVIDEADLMLDMGFIEEVEYIIKCIKNKPIILLFSATLGEHLNRLIDTYMINPEKISIKSEFETASGLVQTAYRVENEDKFDTLMKILIKENPENAMIFCATREMVNTLYNKLKRKKVRCGMLHGAMEQKDRLYAIGDFRKEKFHYLITTDVAARGIDFDNITHVFNYDFPTNKENYVHRIGRSARNGKTGNAISFISHEEEKYKKTVEEYIGMIIEYKELEAAQDNNSKQIFQNRQRERVVIKEGRGAVFNESITKLTIGGGKKSKMRAGDIVGAICSIEDISQDDIGIIDVRDSLTYVEILNSKGEKVLKELENKTIKGKVRKIKKTR